MHLKVLELGKSAISNSQEIMTQRKRHSVSVDRARGVNTIERVSQVLFLNIEDRCYTAISLGGSRIDSSSHLGFIAGFQELFM